MVVDSSALLGEPDAGHPIQAIRQAQRAKVGAPTPTETAVALGLEVAPFTSLHHRVGVGAYARYGEGRPPAGLNLGDRRSHALARTEGEPLSYKGEDFDRTELKWKPS